MHKRIKIEDAKDGMVLDRDVEDKAGRPILKAGDVIKESFVPRLKQWGIDEIFIDAPGEENEDEVQIDTDEIQSKLDNQFQQFDETSHMQKVKKIAEKYLITGRVQF